MKLKLLIAVSFFMLSAFIGACKKKPGPGGKNTISGTIVYKNGVSGNNDIAASATVSIAYDTDAATTEFDKILLTDANGKYSIEGLQKGNYFIKATYADRNGFNYNNPGYAIKLESKKKDLELNITLE